jgi:hypothetical protein
MGTGLGRRFGYNRMLVLAAVGAVAASGLAMVPAAASSGAGASNTRVISSSGTATLAAGDQGSGELQDSEISAGPVDAGGVASGPPNVPTLSADRSKTAGHSAEGNGADESKKDASNPQQLLSFDGLNHFAQRTANRGNQFSVEPPDQGLCAGNGFVLETVNDVLAVYNSTTGNKLQGPVDLNTFYGYAPAIVRATRTTPAVFGPSVTDPSCYFDIPTQRWFHVVLTLETFSSNGRFTGPNHVDIAVSRTADPTGAWNIYRLPIQDDGTDGTPDHHCSTGPFAAFFKSTNPFACLGDYPHIGADANGFYITTNQYSFFGPEFKAAQLYALSKQALASGSSTLAVTQIDTTNMVRGNQAGFTVWPSEVPNGQFDTARDGTEYFMSSNAADEVNPQQNRMSTDLVVWALTNTQSLNSSHPNVSLVNNVLTVGLYAAPPLSNQKVGSTPLRDCINDTTLPVGGGKLGCWRLLFPTEPGHNEVESVIDSNDTRMQQVTFANGMLFGALDTALKVNGKTQAGIEWFATRPHLTSDGVHAQVVNQGYVGAGDTNLTYPALAVNENGAGAIAFSLLGTNDYPSAAYAPFDVKSGVGSIHVAAAGLGPDDGFTGYVAEGLPQRTRWGDYGAAVIDGSKIWIASEYIGQTCTLAQWLSSPLGTCSGTRTSAANWDTRITELAIGGE